MSKSLNDCCFTGYLGGDPRCHTFDDGSRVANLSLAVARQKKENGEWVDDTVWVDVKVSAGSQYTGTVDAIEQYLAKGSFVAVKGELAPIREWTDQSGNKRSTICVDHAAVTFGPRANGDGAQTQQQSRPAAQRPASQTPQPSPWGSLGDDEDIPF